MNTSFHCCIVIAAAGLLIGCGERPSQFVPAVEKAATDPGAAQKARLNVDASVPNATSESPDHERLQGTWRFVTLTTGPGAKDHIAFAGDKISWHVGEKSLEGTFALDATTQPKQIDLRFSAGKDSPSALLGIYDFRSDLLVICLREPGGSRPTKLEAGMDSTLLLFSRLPRETDAETTR